MAKQNRSKLKTHFQTGDVPNQSEYSHLIDSQLNLEDVEIQTIKGGIDCDGGVTGSGVLKGSGLHVTSQASELGGTLAVTGTTSLNSDTLIQSNLNVSASNGHITASGNISSSGTITANVYVGLPSGIISSSQHVFTSITASGNISSSGHISASEFVGKISASNIVQPFTDITLTGNISASGTISASGLFVNGAGTASFGIPGQGHVEIRENEILGFETDDPTRFGYQLITTNQVGIIRLYNGNNLITRVSMGGNSDAIFNSTGINSAGMHIGSNTTGQRMGGSSTAVGPSVNDGFHRKLNVFGGIMTTGSFNHDGGGRITLHDGHITASGNLQVHGAQVDFTNLPTSDPSLSGRLFTQTATELGGSGTTKVICVSAG